MKKQFSCVLVLVSLIASGAVYGEEYSRKPYYKIETSGWLLKTNGNQDVFTCTKCKQFTEVRIQAFPMLPQYATRAGGNDDFISSLKEPKARNVLADKLAHEGMPANLPRDTVAIKSAEITDIAGIRMFRLLANVQIEKKLYFSIWYIFVHKSSFIKVSRTGGGDLPATDSKQEMTLLLNTMRLL